MVQKLNDAGVPANQIIQISGHKNVNSLNNYSSLNKAQQQHISKALSSATPTACAPDNQVQLQPVKAANATVSSASCDAGRPCSPIII